MSLCADAECCRGGSAGRRGRDGGEGGGVSREGRGDLSRRRTVL